MAVPGAPLMTLPDSALRRARAPSPAIGETVEAPPKAPAPTRAELPSWWPSCAVCHSPVELLAWTDGGDAATMVLVSRCHGARQQWTLPRAAALQGALPPAPYFAADASAEPQRA